MNVIKIGLVILTGFGFGFGIDQVVEPLEPNNQYQSFNRGYCHNEEEFLEHLFDGLTEEETIIIEAKIDELLLTYDVTIEELLEDYEVRREFMMDLMDFLEENDIDDYYGGMHGPNQGHHGMRYE